MESMQASLEAEVRSKSEALRLKKKLESDINELEIALDHANKANAEANKAIKRYQGQLRDVESQYEEQSLIHFFPGGTQCRKSCQNFQRLSMAKGAADTLALHHRPSAGDGVLSRRACQ